MMIKTKPRILFTMALKKFGYLKLAGTKINEGTNGRVAKHAAQRVEQTAEQNLGFIANCFGNVGRCGNVCGQRTRRNGG